MTSRIQVSILFAASLLAGCSSEKASEKKGQEEKATGIKDSATAVNTVTLSAAQIQKGKVSWSLPVVTAMAATVEVPAQIVANEDKTARVSAPAESRAIAVHVSPGQRVARGAPLVTLQSQDANMARADVTKAQAEVASRQAAAVYARTARERAERLLALKSIPKQDYERAIADDELAKAGLSQARSELIRARSSAQQLGVDIGSGSMILRSPISGFVVSRDVVPGAVVSAGAPLVTITDQSSLWLTIALPQSLSSSVPVGSTVRFTVASLPADTFTARVQSVGAAFDPGTRSLPLRAEVVNTGERLRPEMFAKAWVGGGVSLSYPTVPDGAIQRLDGKPIILVAKPDGKGGATFEAREVEVQGAGNRWAIVRGLKAGELVVVEGAFAVKSQIARSKMPQMEM